MSPVKVVEVPCLGKDVHDFTQPFHMATKATSLEPVQNFLSHSQPSSSLSLDTCSTLTTRSSTHTTSSHSECDYFASDLTKIPTRFVFADIKTSPTSPTKKLQSNFMSHLKKVFPKKKKAFPLVAALEKRQGPLLNDHYGDFVDTLGAGNGGNVRLMRSGINDQKYAVKTFRPRLPGENETRYYEWLSNEIFLAASVQHPNVVDIHDIVLEDGEIHQVMDYYPSDLFRVVNSGEITVELAGKYFIQLIRGLFYLHGRGYGHRDLKLENLCIDEDGDVKIIDFGCAVVFKTFGYSPKLVEDVCGSDPYIAPELFTGEAYDVRKSDIWSAAIIYITMILKKFPWDIARSSDKSYKLYLEHRKTGRFFNKIPSEATMILRKMLDPNPSTRASMDEILTDGWIQSLDSMW